MRDTRPERYLSLTTHCLFFFCDDGKVCTCTQMPSRNRYRFFFNYKTSWNLWHAPLYAPRSMVAAEERGGGFLEGGRLIPPTPRQLGLYALSVGIPFVGFGLMDNSIMIVSGDLIAHYLGLYLSLSMLASAALGNLVSDVAGVAFGYGTDARSLPKA